MASEHFFYEVWMLRSLAKKLSVSGLKQGPEANALLEAFILHVRVVIDFLYNDSPMPDDIVATDFFDAPEEWTNIRPPMSEALSTAKKRSNKELAHLTYKRLDIPPEGKEWPYIEIRDAITSVVNIFVKNVARDVIGRNLNLIKDIT